MSLLLPVLLLSGCGREKIRVYEAPPSQVVSKARINQETPAETASAGHLHWELPAGWEETSSSGVRTTTFRILGDGDSQAEVAVMPFKKMGGDDLQFVNLWRTTLGLEPVEKDRLPDMVEDIRVGNQSAKLYDVMDGAATGEASPNSRIIVAMAIQGDTSWFFKLAGDASLVSTQKDTFKQFLGTISFHEADAHGDASATEVATTVPAAQFAPDSKDSSLPSWAVPPGWREVPPTTMLLAKFNLSGNEGGQADVTVSVFPGDVGGLLANVNRWRGQLGQAPANEAELEDSLTMIDVGGSRASFVDIIGSGSGSGNDLRLIGAIVPRGGRTWFFKLMGDASVAAQQKDSFLQFLNSVQFPNA